MQRIILISQIIISGLLIFAILLQGKGEGLDTPFTEGKFSQTKRGIEKLMFTATIILGILFFLGAILNLVLSLK